MINGTTPHCVYGMQGGVVVLKRLVLKEYERILEEGIVE